MEVTLNLPRTILKIQINSEEITKKKTTEQEQDKSLKTLYTWKKQLQQNLPTPAQQKTRGGEEIDTQITTWWERPTKKGPKKNQKQKI